MPCRPKRGHGPPGSPCWPRAGTWSWSSTSRIGSLDDDATEDIPLLPEVKRLAPTPLFVRARRGRRNSPLAPDLPRPGHGRGPAPAPIISTATLPAWPKSSYASAQGRAVTPVRSTARCPRPRSVRRFFARIRCARSGDAVEDVAFAQAQGPGPGFSARPGQQMAAQTPSPCRCARSESPRPRSVHPPRGQRRFHEAPLTLLAPICRTGRAGRHTQMGGSKAMRSRSSWAMLIGCARSVCNG